jgi:hypothetical protein
MFISLFCQTAKVFHDISLLEVMGKRNNIMIRSVPCHKQKDEGYWSLLPHQMDR